uniref:100 kDa protein n=1 Tax=Zoothera dauma adenovirus TaxID=3073259 RepID=A0AA51NPI8_9ADEN|nr:100 kDa protein [Zoothera dauma adenovirus]
MDDTTETSALAKHLERQAKIVKAIVGDNESFDVTGLGFYLEQAIFKPTERPTSTEPDPRLNFYPPFLVPECLASHYPFVLNLAIPRSCKANRCGSRKLEDFKNITGFPDEFPTNLSPSTGLGNVETISSLEGNQKFALLVSDTARARWFKSKALQMTHFSYPSVGLPIPIHKILLDEFVSKSQDPNSDEQCKPSITDEDIMNIYGQKVDIPSVRSSILYSVTHGLNIKIMQRFFRDHRTIKNIQDCLHYTFCRGYVQLIKSLTDCSLSEYVTYHGLTHRNRLNNPYLHSCLEGDDKYDYILDTIYLYMVFTWQTAMDIWQQMLDDKTLDMIRDLLIKNKTEILSKANSEDIATTIGRIIFPDVLINALIASLPDFVNQMQLQNFRSFITVKSGVPCAICPILPTDCIPLDYNESEPIMWGHVFLMKLSSFIMNHGTYEKTNGITGSIVESLCECNLCSPHRMPFYNNHLLNEILTINKFEFNGPDGKSIKLTPQIFANAYLEFFKKDDFYPHEVKLYKDNRDSFSETGACVIKNSKLLATLREAQIRREKELLKRGSGLYLNPETGEPFEERLRTLGLTDGREGLYAIEKGRENSSNDVSHKEGKRENDSRGER